MTEFDPDRHTVTGDAAEARTWIEASALPGEQKTDLLTFVGRFPSLTFVKEDDALLDHLAGTGGVDLPPWFREIRRTLAFIEPAGRVRVDDFEQYLSPRSESVDDIWYDLRLGYADDEQRGLLHDKANVYPIGSWWGTDRSYLAVDLEDPANTAILEFASEDLMDNAYEGRPVRGSLYPIFGSYARFLAHVVAVRLADGTEVGAEGS